MICKLNSQIALQFSFFWQSLSSPGFVLLFSLLLNASQWETNPFISLTLITNEFENRVESKWGLVVQPYKIQLHAWLQSLLTGVRLKGWLCYDTNFGALQRKRCIFFSQRCILNSKKSQDCSVKIQFLNVAWLRFWHLEFEHY